MRIAKSSKRLSRKILAQSAVLAVTGMAATQSHAAATDTWVGPASDSTWNTAGNWNITNPVLGQTLPYGGNASAGSIPATDALVFTENDANAYQINFSNSSLVENPADPPTSPGLCFWFTSLNAGNANASGSVTFNVVNGGYFSTSGAITLSNNANLNLGTDGNSGGIITANTTTFGSGSTMNIASQGTFQTSAGALFGGTTLATQTNIYITNTSNLIVGGGDSDFAIGNGGYATANIDSASTLTSAGLESSTADDFFGGLKIGEAQASSTTAASGVLNTGGTVNVAGRLYIGVMQASHNGTGAATEMGSSGLVSMTGGTWNNAGNVLIGMDASSAGNGTATGAVPVFGLAQGELDISGGTFTVAAAKQVYVGASSATGILNVSGGTLNASAGILVGATFDMLANTAGAGVNGAAGAIPGTGTFLFSGGSVMATNLTVGASSNVNMSSGTLTLTTLTANSGSTVLATGGSISLNSLIANAGSMVNLGGATVAFTGTNPSITLNGGGISLSGNFSNVAMNFNVSTNFQGISGGGNQQFGVLNFAGDTTVTSTYAGSGNDFLTFTGINRPVGVTGNFVTSGGTNGVTNSIVLTSQAPGFVSQGVFFGGGNYAWYDASGFLRGINYGSDPGSVTSGATTSVAGTYVQTTGAVSAETTNTFTTLAITGPYNFGLAGGATLTVNGIDKSGGGASIITGGAGIQAANNAELVIRSDSASDSLTISSSILANGTNVLTKSGAGSLTLAGSNTYTGGTIINDGTLVVGSSTALPSTGSVTISPGGTLDLNSQSATIGGLTLAGGLFTNTGGGGSLSLNGDVVSLTSPATFTSGISLSPAAATGAVVRTFNVSGSNAISDLTLSGVISKGGASSVALLKTGSGTLTLSGADSSNSFNTLEVTQGTLRIDGSTGTLTDGQVNLTLGSSTGAAGAFKYDNTTSTGPRISSMGTLTFASGEGTVTSVRTAAQNVSLGFTSIARTSGAIGNLIVTGGTNGTTNKITTGQPAGFIDEGVFFNGNNYAYNDAAGFVRGINYGSDPGSVSSGGSAAGLSPTAGTYLQLTGSVTTQGTNQSSGLMLKSLVLSGTTNLQSTSHNVIQMIDSIDKTGGGTGLVTVGGSMTSLTKNADFVIRTDTATDILQNSWNIQANGVNKLVKSGAGTFQIGTTTNNYTGDTVIDGGVLSFTGSGSGSTIGNFSTLDYNNYGGVLAFGAITTQVFGGLKGSQSLPPLSASTASGAVHVGDPVSLTVGADNQSNTYSGILSGPGSITKTGSGNWTLAAASTYTGATTISSGSLELTSTGSLASPSLTFGANTSLILDAGQAGANFSNGTTLTAGSAASISASGITGTLALGAINRSAGSAIDFGVLPTGSGSFTTTSSNTANTILGGWATVNQSSWATVSGGTIAALASYGSSFASAADVDAPAGTSTPGPGSIGINSLRFNTLGSATVADSGSGDTLTIASGGILVTSGVGANPVTISIANLASGTTELIVDQSNTAAALTISSNISGGIGFTKTGAGMVLLNGSNGYTGVTTIANGTLALASDAAVHGGIGGFNFSGGTLQLNNYASSLNFSNLPALKLSAAAGAASTISGTINGSSGINYVGPGTLVISGTNNYSGGTTVNAGILRAGSTAAFGTNSLVTLANTAGTTLDLNGNNNSIGSLVGGGAIGGNVTLGAGTLSIVGDQYSAWYPNSPVYAGNISGTGGIKKVAGSGGTYGVGVLTLTGSNSYSGGTTIAGGVLAITADTAINSGVGGVSFPTAVTGTNAGGTLQFNGYTSNLSFNNTANLNLGSAIDLAPSTLTGAITGTSKLYYVGPGTLTLAPTTVGANNYIGGTVLVAGTLAIGADSAINNGSGGVSFLVVAPAVGTAAGTLQFDNYTSSLAFASTANLKLGAATGTASTLSGAITGTSPLTYAGPGTLQLTSTGNTYSGGTTVVGGTLQLLSNSTTIGNTSSGLTVNPGGTLDLNGTNQSVGNLNGGAGTGFILNNNTSTVAILTVGNNNTSGNFGGGIINNTSGTGTVGLTKVGTGTETLSRADNTYSGTTTISAGNLSAGAANAFSPNSQVSLANVAGANLALANFGNTIGSLTGGGPAGGNVNLGTGLLTVGADNTSPAAYAGVISSTNTAGGVTKIGTGTLILSGINTYTSPTQVSSGTLEIAPTGSLALTANITVNATSAAAAVKYDTRTATGVQPITVSSLTLVTGGTLSLANTGSAATAGSLTNHPNRMQLITTTLNNSTGSIDLGGNDMIVHNANASAAAITLTAVTNQLTTGYSAGTWAGTANGSIHSSAAAADITHLTALGSATGLSSFDSGTVLATDVLVKYTYYGDATLDGKVDSSDYTRIDSGFLSHSTGWSNGDFNYDGVINGSDYTLIDNAFNIQGAQLSAQIASPTAQIAGSAAASSVPEPTMVGLLGIGVVGLLGRRGGRRHR